MIQSSLSKRLFDLNLPGKVEKVSALPSNFRRQLEELLTEARQKIGEARYGFEAADAEYRLFRQSNGLDREPRVHDDHRNYLFVIAGVLLAQISVNMFFFERGSMLGLLGGAIYAFLLATIDISISFAFGRGITRRVSRKTAQSLVGVLCLACFAAWAFFYNLGVAHVREQLRAATSEPLREALRAFQENIFGLTLLDSWALFVAGVVLSFFAMGSGYKWDEEYPGYGHLYRTRRGRQADYHHFCTSWRAAARLLKEKYLEQLDKGLNEIRTNVVLLENAITTKATLLRNVQGFVEHYEDSGNALIQIYRDENQKHRTTPPPQHFDTRFKLEIPKSLRDTTGQDEARLEEAQGAVSEAVATGHERSNDVAEIYDRFVERAEAELEIPHNQSGDVKR